MNSDTYAPLTSQDWWKPMNPPTDESNPLIGSSVIATFSPEVKFTSVIVEERLGNMEDVRLAIGVKYNLNDVNFTPLKNEQGGLVFYGYTGSKIYGPADMPHVFALEVFIVKPNPVYEYRLTFQNCVGK